MFDMNKFKKDVANKYKLDNKCVKCFLRYFLGENYDVYLEKINFSEVCKILDNKMEATLSNGNNKIAKIFTYSGDLRIDFYDTCQESPTLYASISIDKFDSNYELIMVNVVEFIGDNSIICSQIRGDITRGLNNKHDIVVSGYKLYTYVYYYNPTNAEYFDRNDRNFNTMNNTEYLARACFMPDLYIPFEKKSQNEFERDAAYFEFIEAREELNKRIKESNDAEINQQLLKKD